MSDATTFYAVHAGQVLCALLGAWYLVRASRGHATGVRNRLDDVGSRAVANVEIEAQDVRAKLDATEETVQRTANTTDSKIEALAEKLEEKP